jgi:hypothetical protein
VILAAGLLVLLGLGLFVAGILTGMTALYWACVAACVVAAVLLALTRRQMAAARAEAVAAPATPVTPVSGRNGPPRAVDDPASDPAAVVPGGAIAAAVAAEPEQLADPPVEEVEVTDLLMVVDLTDEVLVIDERPRYHLAGCVHLSGRTAIPLPLDEARTDGFTPCAVCAPDRTLAQRARERK